MKRKKQESQQLKNTSVRMSSCEAVLCLPTTTFRILVIFVSRLKALAATHNLTEEDTKVKSQLISVSQNQTNKDRAVFVSKLDSWLILEQV